MKVEICLDTNTGENPMSAKPTPANKPLFALFAGLTAFLLTSLAALGIYLAQQGTTTVDTSSAAAMATVTPDQTANTEIPDLNAQLQALIDSRESAYRAQLQQANQQLQQANAQLSQAYARLNELAAKPPAAVMTPAEQPTPTPPEPAPAYAVSPEQAASITLGLAPGVSITRSPDLVDFQGTVAYEVQTNLGLVYVDANNGRVLYDGTARATTSGGPGTTLDRVPREHENDEGEGDDGDD